MTAIIVVESISMLLYSLVSNTKYLKVWYEDAIFSYTESEGNLVIAQKAYSSKNIMVENWNANSKEALGDRTFRGNSK